MRLWSRYAFGCSLRLLDQRLLIKPMIFPFNQWNICEWLEGHIFVPYEVQDGFVILIDGVQRIDKKSSVSFPFTEALALVLNVFPGGYTLMIHFFIASRDPLLP